LFLGILEAQIFLFLCHYSGVGALFSDNEIWLTLTGFFMPKNRGHLNTRMI